jgi:tRNA A-37 threonylcarbamoyl transferase component Bud32
VSYLVAFGSEKSSFVSMNGIESTVTLTPEIGCDYYLVSDGDFIVKLKNKRIAKAEYLGEVVTKNGTLISKIPHPGLIHGDLRTAGMVSGNSITLKFIIESLNNPNAYFLSYNIANKRFTSAGNTVR